MANKKQKYVVFTINPVTLEHGSIYSGGNGVTEKKALKMLKQYGEVGLNLGMIGIEHYKKQTKESK